MTLKNLLILLVIVNISLALWQLGRIQLTAVDAPLPGVALVGEAAISPDADEPTTTPSPTKTTLPTPKTTPANKQPTAVAKKPVVDQTTKPKLTATAKPTTPTQPTLNTALVCSRYGPFTDKAKAQKMVTKLAAQKATVKLIDKKSKRKTGSAVQLIALDEIDFSQLKRDLVTFDIKDWSIVRREGERFIISVGVFSTQENLEARLAQIAYLDRDPLVVDFNKAVTEYELLVKAQAQNKLTPTGKIIPCK